MLLSYWARELRRKCRARPSAIPIGQRLLNRLPPFAVTRGGTTARLRPFGDSPPPAQGTPRPLTSSRPPSCPCSPWRPARPASPWRCGWPRCWGPRPAGSPARSAGTRGPASRRSHPPPRVRRCPWLCCCPLLLPLPGQTLSKERHGGAICSSSVMLLRSVIVIFSKASSESAQPNPAQEAAMVLGLCCTSVTALLLPQPVGVPFFPFSFPSLQEQEEGKSEHTLHRQQYCTN
uniref:Uncharacterized protein n=1 Tax=Amazona collaria TaxID=241587 RepID=A0A8B9J009_9PSIT